ncbi:DUF4396 domain-containing protein [Legionella israelensis]|uniref:Integral membrane protein n=1 Tax=Legionella israelensis TaxID=454 RepID=A0A0W0VH48_9GAMM|nr:DUF4396 domain-containing protein [Legionella israelensis]KTD19460.1 integral membrane protein [Legionella israelensis]QBS08400.1 DUF4396 domain-containing protein [Legionella israelensis]SCX92168.1 protein of unknown function [Legionella israelensis DSM 19235]STX58034.1 integral membrane protein [Legionella israelensis]
MLAGIMILWFIFVLLSLAYVAYDIRVVPIDWVQKLGWILVVAYTGPIGLFFYFLTCRSPGEGLHEIYTKAQWKQAVNSEVHCLAGDATGIIFAAILLSFIELNNGTELVFEYISAFIFGWFIFQAGMMKNMYANYWQAVKKTFFSETVSMNFVMMGIATVLGGIIAFPINHWLVKNKLKHGCMTLPEANLKQAHETKAHPAKSAEEEKMHVQHKADEHHHEMGELPLKTQLKYTGITFAVLVLVVIITGLFVPIKF